MNRFVAIHMMQPRQSQSREEANNNKKRRRRRSSTNLGKCCIFTSYLCILKNSPNARIKSLEITVAGPVPVSPTFINLALSASVPSPFAFFLYLLLCLPALNPHKKNILVLLFNKKKIPVQVEAFSRDSFYSYVHLVRCSPPHSPAFPCILLV